MDDETADFAAWYDANYRRLVATMHVVTGDRSAAIEAVDEACARAFERWSRVRRMQSPEGWTWIVARNAFRTTRRSERERAAAHHRSLVQEHAAPPAMDIEVWDAVQRLPRRQREVVALRYLAGLREREIAELLSIAPGTVASTLHDARGVLAATLRDEPHVEYRRD